MTSPIQKLAESIILEASLGMTEKKLKFLIYVAQQVFETKQIIMTFDATKDVPSIVLTPQKNDKLFLMEEWDRQYRKWNFSSTCENLQKFLGVDSKVKVVFKRTVPKVRK